MGGTFYVLATPTTGAPAIQIHKCDNHAEASVVAAEYHGRNPSELVEVSTVIVTYMPKVTT